MVDIKDMKRVTIYNVAHEAGVSLATVSRVINGSTAVREETKEKVKAAIAKLDYKPSAIAQGLALQKTTTIALVVPETSFNYTGKVINGLLNTAKIYQYNIVLLTSTAGINEMNEIIENVIKSRLDGVVVYNDYLKPEELSALKNYNIPIVYIGNKVDCENICSVYVDYKKAVKDFVAGYLDKGIDDIALLQDRKNQTTIDQLHEGIKEAYQERGKKFTGYIEIPEDAKTTYTFVHKYFADHTHKLVIANRDSQALAVLNSCNEHGIKIPDDLELFCVMDSKYNEMVRPEVSGLWTPSYDLGTLAMRLMTKMLDKSEIAEKNIELGYLMINRSSTKSHEE